MMNKGNLKISRNALCPCGSGIKYKKCCLNCRSMPSVAVQQEEMQRQFKEKMAKKIGQMTLIENASGLKMSEVMIEFAQELLSQAKTRAEKERVIQFACTAWNFALLKQRNEKDYQNKLHSIFKQVTFKDSIEQNVARLLTEDFVDKKIACYPQIDRWIIDYQVSWMGDELRLHIASLMASEEMDNRRVLDRIFVAYTGIKDRIASFLLQQ